MFDKKINLTEESIKNLELEISYSEGIFDKIYKIKDLNTMILKQENKFLKI